MSFLSHLINGISLGSIYAIIALGYTMVYGIAKMLNFAHGDVIMVGLYTIWVCLTEMKLPIPLTLLFCVLICAILGFGMEKLAYKPLRRSSPLAVLITAIGVSYLLQNIALLVFSSRRKFFTAPIKIPDIQVAGINIPGISLLILGVTILIMVGLSLFINKTRMGSAMLAVSEDKGAAQLMGINVNRTISITFLIGSALAGVAAILYASAYETTDPYVGSLLGIKAFSAAVFGGIGSVPGAMIGGLSIGVIETFTRNYLPPSISPVADGFAFLILVIMMIAKPSGLLGKKRMEKV